MSFLASIHVKRCIEGGLSNLNPRSGFTNRKTLGEQRLCAAELVLGHHRRASALPPAGNGCNQPGAGPFTD